MIVPNRRVRDLLPDRARLSWLLMPHPRAWEPFLIAVSYVFYAAAGWKFCLLLITVTVGNHVAARLIGRMSGWWRRRVAGWMFAGRTRSARKREVIGPRDRCRQVTSTAWPAPAWSAGSRSDAGAAR
jgi:hypothetical protein